MSNSKKITDLAAYTDSQVQSNDLLFITDIAAQETKKITAIDIADYAFNAKSASIFNGNYTGSFTGSFSGSFTGNLTGTSSWATNALVADSVTGGTGEANTASNTGSYGYGLVSNKVGVDLRFKQIGAGNNINIDLDTGDANVLKISALSTLTSPGGATGNVQFNSNAGTFGGNSNLSWDTTTNNKLTVAGNVYSTNFSSSITNAVGYFGTASFAISSSNAISSSYALSSSYSKNQSSSSNNSRKCNDCSGTGKCRECSKTFIVSYYDDRVNSFKNRNETRLGYVMCGVCRGAGVSYKRSDFPNVGKWEVEKKCYVSLCKNGWVLCNTCKYNVNSGQLGTCKRCKGTGSN